MALRRSWPPRFFSISYLQWKPEFSNAVVQSAVGVMVPHVTHHSCQISKKPAIPKSEDDSAESAEASWLSNAKLHAVTFSFDSSMYSMYNAL